jgi:hypothetical protein
VRYESIDGDGVDGSDDDNSDDDDNVGDTTGLSPEDSTLPELPPRQKVYIYPNMSRPACFMHAFLSACSLSETFFLF